MDARFLVIVASAMALWLVFFAAYHFETSSGIGRQDFSGADFVVPVDVFVVASKPPYNSARSVDNIRAVFSSANKIWAPAGIAFDVKSIRRLAVSESAAAHASGGDISALVEAAGVREKRLNAFFIGRLRANGIAFHRYNSFIISDRTTVNDFRAVAHELGHLLGLAHHSGSDRFLMFQGANGEIISEEEIRIARELARGF